MLDKCSVALAVPLCMLLGCGDIMITQDAEFKSYIQQFDAAFNVSTTVPVVYGHLSPGTAAICSGSGKVTVDKGSWEAATEAQRTQLIFHELSHCVLGHRFHITDTLSDGCPASVLYPYNFGNPCMSNHYDYYVRERKR
jgi:hypothetical protein